MFPSTAVWQLFDAGGKAKVADDTEDRANGPSIIMCEVQGVRGSVKKDGSTVYLRIETPDADGAEWLAKSLAMQLEYGCVHLHLPSLSMSPDDERRMAMEEKRMTRPRMN